MLSSPDENLAELSLHEGQTVADFGSGTGHHAIAAARLVGGSGTVYAVEIQKNLLDAISLRAREAGVGNVKIVWGDIDEESGVKLGDRVCDVVIIANVLFQVENKLVCAKNAYRILRPGGTVLVIDWVGSFNNMGPHPSAVVTADMAKKIFLEAGFSQVREFNAGRHHYGIIFKK